MHYLTSGEARRGGAGGGRVAPRVRSPQRALAGSVGVVRARVGALTTLGPTGRVAAQNMLAQEAEISTVPYLWTAMFGKSLRYAGNGGAPGRGGAKSI